jgi:glycosyltransferase involved in cell wall biosynthesis
VKILVVCSTGGISGGGDLYFLRALARIHDVRSLEIKLSRFNFLRDRMRAFSPYPNPYERFPGSFFPNNKNTWSFMKRTQICERKIEKMTWRPDIVLQLGLYLSPTTRKNAFPYTCYVDSTSKVSEREYPPWGETYSSKTDKTNWMNLQQNLFSRASKIFTMSEYARKSVIEDFHVHADKVAAVYAGPNLDRLPSFEKNVSNKMILFVGKDFRRKGGITLFRAFKEVKRRVGDAKLFIVGSRPEISSPGITVKGFVKKEELTYLYRNASVFVMPSIYEPFGHVFLEAMAYKTPCIGSNKDAMPEIIEDGKSGFTIPLHDHRQLSEKIVYLLEDENLIRSMGEEGRRRIERSFNWDAVARRITEKLS